MRRGCARLFQTAPGWQAYRLAMRHTVELMRYGYMPSLAGDSEFACGHSVEARCFADRFASTHLGLQKSSRGWSDWEHSASKMRSPIVSTGLAGIRHSCSGKGAL